MEHFCIGNVDVTPAFALALCLQYKQCGLNLKKTHESALLNYKRKWKNENTHKLYCVYDESTLNAAMISFVGQIFQTCKLILHCKKYA